MERRLKPSAYTGYGMAQNAPAIPENGVSVTIAITEDRCRIID